MYRLDLLVGAVLAVQITRLVLAFVSERRYRSVVRMMAPQVERLMKAAVPGTSGYNYCQDPACERCTMLREVEEADPGCPNLN